MILRDKNGMEILIKERAIVFDDAFEVDTITHLIDQITDCEENYINLYWSSCGGLVNMMNFLVDYIKNSDKFFNVVVSGEAASAGLFTLCAIKDFKNVVISKLYHPVHMMAHSAETYYSSRDLNNKKSGSYQSKKYAYLMNDYLRELVKPLLTESELQDYDDGLDVYVSPLAAIEHFELSKDEVINKTRAYFLSEFDRIECPDVSFEDEDFDAVPATEEDEETAEKIKAVEIDEEYESYLSNQPERGFMVVAKEHRKHPDAEITLPTRGSAYAAGYDICVPVDVVLEAGARQLVWTDVKVHMPDDEYVQMHVRSSVGTKKGIVLSNGTGIIDSDYFENTSNDGNVGIALWNTSNQTQFLKAGERVGQLVFSKYQTVEDSNNQERTGGFGSTN